MVPNKWVIDAVNLAVKSDHQWNVVAPSLDAGFTYWAEQMNDASSYRKAVLRKKNGTKMARYQLTQPMTLKLLQSLLILNIN